MLMACGITQRQVRKQNDRAEDRGCWSVKPTRWCDTLRGNIYPSWEKKRPKAICCFFSLFSFSSSSFSSFYKHIFFCIGSAWNCWCTADTDPRLNIFSTFLARRVFFFGGFVSLYFPVYFSLLVLTYRYEEVSARVYISYTADGVCPFFFHQRRKKKRKKRKQNKVPRLGKCHIIAVNCRH